MTRWPPATRVSLLAVATTLPARSAARTGRRLTTPPVATTTRSTSSRVASSIMASSPAARSVPAGRSSSRASASGSARATIDRPELTGLLGEARPRRGRSRGRRPGTHPGARPGPRRPAPRSSRWSRAARRRAAQARRATTYSVIDRCGEQERVHAVQHPTVARDQRAGVLGARGPLEHRLGEVTGLGGQGGEWPEQQGVERRLPEPPQQDADDDRRRPRRHRPARHTSSRARCGSGTAPGRTGGPTRNAPVS